MTAALANQLYSRPDLQAQVSSLAGYTPSEWLMEPPAFVMDSAASAVPGIHRYDVIDDERQSIWN